MGNSFCKPLGLEIMGSPVNATTIITVCQKKIFFFLILYFFINLFIANNIVYNNIFHHFNTYTS